METEGKALDSDHVACHSTLDCTKFPEIDAPRCNKTGLYNKRGSSYWQSVLLSSKGSLAPTSLVVAQPCWYLQDKCQNEGGQHLQTLAFPQQIKQKTWKWRPQFTTFLEMLWFWSCRFVYMCFDRIWNTHPLRGDPVQLKYFKRHPPLSIFHAMCTSACWISDLVGCSRMQL
jgi:hypothetical protein